MLYLLIALPRRPRASRRRSIQIPGTAIRGWRACRLSSGFRVADVRLEGNPHQSLCQRDQCLDRADMGHDIDVKLGDPLNGYKAEGKVGTVTEIADWLRLGRQTLPKQRVHQAVRGALNLL
jgi:hypothetical protein